ncbi:hypothetical protein ABZ816_34075 [Actinosynnema sp. NPDC047251]|uniref:DUF402 domain-containing protein n=1 Tax=Saccharothrix espanaensis (strain ATCC 51144 / DSM 44229 / JCM 9112 / NBRC 15066 / NRRL 15764) TaxID=1179773 RepID=K0JWP1_SACES|nr:hypothetical protein [Saccharothrix espanaensis]CCH32270.1 hypothetical protein BN6_50020 [Saccharothrix espanaensis DSM 44229]
MKKSKATKPKHPLAAPRETFANALGRPVDSVEARTVIDVLGGTYEVRPIGRSTARYDPDRVCTVAWDFPSAPPANRWTATHLGVRDDTIVWITLSSTLVEGVRGDQGVFLRLSDDDEQIFRPQGSDWNWAPAIVRRGAGYLLDLDVGQGHWDGNYKFPLTPRQAASLEADPLLYREVWNGLVRICQSRRFFDDPTTLPADAQAVIDARCGRG